MENPYESPYGLEKNNQQDFTRNDNLAPTNTVELSTIHYGYALHAGELLVSLNEVERTRFENIKNYALKSDFYSPKKWGFRWVNEGKSAIALTARANSAFRPRVKLFVPNRTAICEIAFPVTDVDPDHAAPELYTYIGLARKDMSELLRMNTIHITDTRTALSRISCWMKTELPNLLANESTNEHRRMQKLLSQQ
jgi:hypothetical protein